MADRLIPLEWKRPSSVEYPKVWLRFKAKDLNSDELVEYRIEDLLESRAEESFIHMKENYLRGEPVSEALDGYNDIDHYEDYKLFWESILAQKTTLVCYKEGSDEIVGINWNFVVRKDDHFTQKCYDQCKSPVSKALFGTIIMMYKKFDPYKHYGVDEYLTSLSLSVDKKYRGRGVGYQFMAARKFFCGEFGLKLTHTNFTSEFAARNAEKAGFRTDVSISFDEVMKIHPEYNLRKINSPGMVGKSLFYT